jgi:hypothetical protein
VRLLDLDITNNATHIFPRHELPEPADKEISNFFAEDRIRISNNIAACLAPVNIPDEPTNTFDTNKADLSSLSFDKLVRLRFAHQTKQAATGVRTRMHASTPPAYDDTQVEPEKGTQRRETERQSLLRRFNEVIKQQQDRGKGTGAERGLRWGTTPAAGNAANAADAAAARSTKVSFSLKFIVFSFLHSTCKGLSKTQGCVCKVRVTQRIRYR